MTTPIAGGTAGAKGVFIDMVALQLFSMVPSMGQLDSADDLLESLDDVDDIAKLRAVVGDEITDDALELLGPTYRRVVEQGGTGGFTFNVHDGKTFAGRGLPALDEFAGEDILEWVMARPGEKRGLHRMITVGDVQDPQALFLWVHDPTDPTASGTLYRLI